MSQSENSGVDVRAPGTPVIVDVFARTRPDGEVDFSHEWRWQGGPKEGTGTIKIPSRKSQEDGTPMHFHLRDETSPKRGLQFAEEQGTAMWVLRDSCPSGGTRCDDPEIPPEQMNMSPQLLKAFNINGDDCSLHYRLWFKDDQGKSESYDPDIKNGGKI